MFGAATLSKQNTTFEFDVFIDANILVSLAPNVPKQEQLNSNIDKYQTIYLNSKTSKAHFQQTYKHYPSSNIKIIETKFAMDKFCFNDIVIVNDASDNRNWNDCEQAPH